MNIFYFDWGRENSTVYRMDTTNGKGLKPRVVRGSLDNQVKLLVDLVEDNRPHKIIFDKSDMGAIFKNRFAKLGSGKGIYLDKSGNLQYLDQILL